MCVMKAQAKLSPVIIRPAPHRIRPHRGLRVHVMLYPADASEYRDKPILIGKHTFIKVVHNCDDWAQAQELKRAARTGLVHLGQSRRSIPPDQPYASCQQAKAHFQSQTQHRFAALFWSCNHVWSEMSEKQPCSSDYLPLNQRKRAASMTEAAPSLHLNDVKNYSSSSASTAF